MKIFSLFLLFLISISLLPARSAQISKNVVEYAGQRCNTPKRGSGIIAGYFSGVTDNPIVSSDGLVPVDRYRCFKSMDECRGWLYTMESLYGSPPPTATICTRY
ncbi:hypothetical protein [uncultured Bartonella sp.]|uniref:hypothetical protein n=1 Tax=uncultured Bartonella sp. TaxID=104108 RepID=UPI00261DC8E2|nr:hypothetical protein [uncultured Bartonella sp.]